MFQEADNGSIVAQIGNRNESDVFKRTTNGSVVASI